MKSRYFILLIFSSSLNKVAAQENKFIRYTQGIEGDRVEFLSLDGKVVKTINPLDYNRYASLQYPSTKNGSRIHYDISGVDKHALLSFFFLYPLSKEAELNLDPGMLYTTTYVLTDENNVVFADRLYLVSKEGGGAIGLRSVASVFDKKGNLLGTLPENNDGYGSSVVVNDNYVGTNFGDSFGEGSYTVVPTPGFRIYDMKTNSIIYESREGGVNSPTSQHGMITQVWSEPDRYHYVFFKPLDRILYRKTFTTKEVNEFVKFVPSGIIVIENGKERLLAFDKEFVRSSF